MKLKQSDLDFILAQIVFGATPAPGTVPIDIRGIRNVDGTFNNLLHINGFDPLTPFTDQYGDTVNTDSFGTSNQPFINVTPKVFDNGPTADAQLPAALGFPIAAAFAAPGATFGDNYAQSLNVIDTSPRIISNLVVDMNQAPPEATGNPGDPAIFVTPFNSLFTIFGQFVDHGLDFINKGGDGIVLIPDPAGRSALQHRPRRIEHDARDARQRRRQPATSSIRPRRWSISSRPMARIRPRASS